MKTNILKTSLLALIIALGSCSKDDSTSTPIIETPVTMTDDQVSLGLKTDMEIDTATDEFGQIAESATAAKGTAGMTGPTICDISPVGVVDIATMSYVFTYDFGNSGTCKTKNGKSLTGVLKIYASSDKSLTFQYVNLMYGNLLLNGKIKFIKSVVDGKRKLNSIQDKLEVSFPEKGKYIRNSNIIRTQIKGNDTPDNYMDDQFTTEGYWSTVFPDGKSNMVKITEMLLIDTSCPFKKHIKGKIDFNLKGNIGKIDFGDGTCEAKWKITRNGKEFVITRLGEKQP